MEIQDTFDAYAACRFERYSYGSSERGEFRVTITFTVNKKDGTRSKKSKTIGFGGRSKDVAGKLALFAKEAPSNPLYRKRSEN